MQQWGLISVPSFSFMDGLTLTASVSEIKALIGGRIEKIQQPERYELLFVVHAGGETKRLFISSSPDNCRIQLTNEKRTSPIDAPNFLMLLRKHLLGAKVVSIEQPNLDRIVIIRFSTLDELHDEAEYSLVCEIMGKHSNIILVDGSGMIIDAARRVSASMSSVRLILPHLKYEFPPSQDKHDPSAASVSDFKAALESGARLDKALSNNFYGLSPSVAALLIDAVCDYSRIDPSDTDKLSEGLYGFYRSLSMGSISACIANWGGSSTLLPFIPASDDFVRFSSLAEAADEFYRRRSQAESVKRRTASIERVIMNNIQRLERKIEKFSLSIGDEAEIEKLRKCGELITANLYRIPPRANEALLEDYYADPPEIISVELDGSISASANAQAYYKKYRKAKSARESAIVQQAEAMRELEYLSGILSDLSECVTDSDFDEVKSELSSAGYIKLSRNSRTKLPKSKPYRYVSSDGIDILVGKNNIQNDRLTFKESSPDDIWLHTKDFHGSHVIILSGGEAPDTTLLEAAELAAYYSKARDSGLVPVDYTQRRFVKKPSGAKPGMVIYTNQRTLYVTPSAEKIDKLNKKN